MHGDTLRTRLMQVDVRPGFPSHNAARMLDAVAEARRDGVELLVFPEMAIPGYLIGDAWERESFLRECEDCAAELRDASRGLCVIFGSVGVDWRRRNEDGRVRKYNALFVAEDGRFVGPERGPYEYVVKTLLPNYREFDDSRHFYDLRRLAQEMDRAPTELLAPVRTRRARLGCLLCEDAWDLDYALSPMDALARAGADLLVNISASPFTAGKDAKRKRVFAARAAHYARPLLYVNNVGIQDNGKTVFTFDGASCLYDGRGGRLPCGAPFEETALTADVTPGAAAPGPAAEAAAAAPDGPPEIAAALLYGTRRFMERCAVERVVVGVSGGIDSALVAALYRALLPPDRLLLVNLPGPYTSPTTRRLADALADGLGCFYVRTPIDAHVDLTRRALDGLAIASADGSLRRTLPMSDLAFENVQARDRSARALAAIAAMFGGVFTCNANKSEATVGYTTLYGDLGGYFANIADLWKTDVYAVARHVNETVYGREAIPRGSFDVAPSAELSSAQNVDEGKGDPLIYPYHDRLFESWVERWNRLSPEEILARYAEGRLEQEIGYSGRVGDLFPDAAGFVRDLERWWGLYQGMGVAKRIQAPPILAVKRRAFGFDHREAQTGAGYTRRYGQIKARLLAGAGRADA